MSNATFKANVIDHLNADSRAILIAAHGRPEACSDRAVAEIQRRMDRRMAVL